MDAPTFLLEKPEADYTIICNAVLRDRSISLRAKGLYALMTSKPNGWVFYETALQQESLEGRDALRAAMRELMQAGWVEKQRHREVGKFAGSVFKLHITSDWKTVDGKTVAGESTTNKTDKTKTEEVIPPVSPKPTKASRRGPTSAIRLEEFLGNTNGFPPVEWTNWAFREFGWDVPRCGFEWEDFRDYWTSGNAVHGGRKADWFATWRSHCRRSANRGGGRANGGSSDRGLAAAMRSSLAQRYGAAQPGGEVSRGTSAAGADVDGRGEGPTVPPGEIPF